MIHEGELKPLFLKIYENEQKSPPGGIMAEGEREQNSLFAGVTVQPSGFVHARRMAISSNALSHYVR